MKSGPISSNPAASLCERPSAARADFPEALPVVGVTAFTTIDYPGYLSAVFYTQGCPWRCRYCHNASLRPMDENPETKLSWEKLSRFLETRRGFLEGVVFCGGEPTLHPELPQALEAVRAMGFKAGLHTSGMFPSTLTKILPHCDWVGMDVKAPFDHYEKVTMVPNSGRLAEESVRAVVRSAVKHEFRTTFHPDLLSEEDVAVIGDAIAAMGGRHYALQVFQSRGCEDQRLRGWHGDATYFSRELVWRLNGLFDTFEIRD